MFLFRRERLIRYRLLPLVLALASAELGAESIDYRADPRLAEAKVSTAKIQSRYVPVREIVAVVEAQTDFRFVYDVERLPMDAEVLIESSGVVPLPQLLTEISSQVALVFRQRNGLIAMWAMGADDLVVAPVASRTEGPDRPAAPVVESMAIAETPVSAAVEAAAEPASERVSASMYTGGDSEPVATAAETDTGSTAAPTSGVMSAFGGTTPDFTSQADNILHLDALKIEGGVVKGSAADLRAIRQKADVAVDFLSADQMAKYSATDLAEIVIRIPGVSVAGGQFAVIRGLSDRYTNTTFNGLKLPSPDPERQSPQLDILPTALVDSIVVAKSFAPSLWADTSGGAINLGNAVADPDNRRVSVSYGVRMHENASDGGPRYEVPNRSNDWAAAGARSRPGDSVEEFQKPWDFVPQHDSLPLGQKFAFGYSDGFHFGEKALGLNIGLSYDSSATQRTGQRQSLLLGHTDDEVSLENSEYRTGRPTLLDGGTWDYEQSRVEVAVSGSAAVSFKISQNHDLRATAFWTRTGTDTVQANQSPLTTYTVRTPAGNIVETQVAFDQGEYRAGDYSQFVPQAIRRHRDVQVYTERKLALLQLGGTHQVDSLGGMRLDWVMQQASTYQDEPNLIDARYYYQLGQNPANSDFNYDIPIGQYGIPPSGSPNLNRFWGTTHESQSSFRVDGEWAALDFAGRNVRLQFGVASEDTERDFQGSNYTGVFHDLTREERTDQDLDEIFNKLVAKERPVSNRTEQERDITATYVNLAVDLPGKLEAVAGARFERFAIRTEGKDKVNRTTTAFLYHYSAFPIFGAEHIPSFSSTELTENHVTRVKFSELNWYPSLGVIFRPSDAWTVRTTASKTSGRPSLREMGPYYNRSLESGEYVVGNPFLRSSGVSNLDLRVEWSPSTKSRLALSVFAKRIKNPIEKIFLPGAINGDAVETWSNNANTAKLHGAEFEFSQELPWGFTLGGNVTRIDAEVEEHPAVLAKLRADSHLAEDETIVRPLFDQPDYIANLDLTWSRSSWGTSITLAANATSDVLESTGGGTVFGMSDPTLDIYDRATHRLDLTFSQVLFAGVKMKIALNNLTDPAIGTLYDPSRTPEELIRNAYHAGRSYSLTLSKAF